MEKIHTFLKAHLGTVPQSILYFIIVASLSANAYLLYEKQHYNDRSGYSSAQQEQHVGTAVSKDIHAPYGMKSASYATFEDGKWNTYSTSTPLTEDDVLEMRQEFIKRQYAMEEYFRRQGELMRDFWTTF